MVMVLPARAAVTPGGKPVGLPMLVTPMVAWVTDGVSATSTHAFKPPTAGAMDATVMVPVTVPQPPTKVPV